MKPDIQEIDFEKISTAKRGLPGHGSDINRWADECQDKYKREVKPKWRKKSPSCVRIPNKVDPINFYEVNCGEITLQGHQFPEGIQPVNAQEIDPEKRLLIELQKLQTIKQLSSPSMSE